MDNKKIEILYNKTLCKLYPFVEINMPDDNPYKYSFTWLDDIPGGWRKAFGIILCDEILDVCKTYDINPKEIQFIDIKEKYGGLDIWFNFYNENLSNEVTDALYAIVLKYRDLSEMYCMNCGEKGKITSYKGWVCTLCEKCKLML